MPSGGDVVYDYNGSLIKRRVRAFFIPGFIVTLAVTLSMFLDILLVGRMVGTAEMGAVQMALPVTMFFNMIYMLFGTGGELLVASAKGAQNGREADKVFSLTMGFVVLLSLAVAVLGASFSGSIADVLDKGSAAMTPLIAKYIRILFLGAPLMICVMSCSSFVKADALPNLSAGIALTANVVNIIAKIIYMGPFKMGLAGAALGSVTGYTAGLALLAACWLCNRKKRVLNIVAVGAGDLGKLGNVFLTGLPSSLGQGLGAVISWATNALILSVAGQNGLVAMTAANSLVIFLSTFRYAAPMAIAPLVGAMYGERDWWSMTQTAKKVMLICVVGTIVCILPAELFPAKVIAGFGARDPQVIAMGSIMLRVLCLNVVLSVMIHIIMTYYQATGRKTLSIAISAMMDPLDYAAKYICCMAMGVAGLYVAPIAASIIIIALIFGAARYVEYSTKKAQLSYHGAFLIHECNLPYAESNTIRCSEEEARGFARTLKDFSLRNGLSQAIADRAVEIVGKAASGVVAKNAAKHDKSIDVMSVVWKGALQIRIRDDGPKFASESEDGGLITHAAIMGYNDTFVKVSE